MTEMIKEGYSRCDNINRLNDNIILESISSHLKQLNFSATKFYFYNAHGDTFYDLDLVKDYLTKNKERSRENLKNENTYTLTMAIQIALETKGYDVGRVDGIYKNKGAKTSKTIEAIKKFQQDHGLLVDGIPGPKTITKLLEGFKTETIDKLLEKEELTIEDAEKIREARVLDLNLSVVQNLTPDLIQHLFQETSDKQYFDILTIKGINVDTAQEIIKYKIRMLKFYSVTEEVAKVLAKADYIDCIELPLFDNNKENIRNIFKNEGRVRSEYNDNYIQKKSN